VYTGLDSAQASMEIVGDVYALSSNRVNVTQITFQIHSVLADDAIDMGKTKIDYTDNNVYYPNIIFSFSDLTTGSPTTLGPSDRGQINISITGIAGANLTAYSTFTLEIIPITGAVVAIQRALPGKIDAVMDLH